MAQRPSGVGAGAELHRVLQDCKLLEYEPLLLEEGEAFVVSLVARRHDGVGIRKCALARIHIPAASVRKRRTCPTLALATSQ